MANALVRKSDLLEVYTKCLNNTHKGGLANTFGYSTTSVFKRSLSTGRSGYLNEVQSKQVYDYFECLGGYNSLCQTVGVHAPYINTKDIRMGFLELTKEAIAVETTDELKEMATLLSSALNFINYELKVRQEKIS